MGESGLLALFFWVPAGLIVYSYVGYPLLLTILARVRPAARGVDGASGFEPEVTVLIVAHNEGAAIRGKVENCLAQDYPAARVHVLVASDGSTDGTDAIVTAMGSPRVTLLRVPGPAGKPSAINAAMSAVRGEILVLCDARQRLATDAVRRLISGFADPGVGAITGELVIEDGDQLGRGVGLYWKLEKRIRELESDVGSVVGATGALYAIRRSLFLPLHPATILDDVAIPMGVVRAGYRVVFERGAVAYDRSVEDPAREFRRKVRTLAGNLQLLALQPWLLDPRANRLWWQFLSHKLSRLAVPWLLVAVAAASAFGGGWYRLALAVQIAFYAAAAMGWLLQQLRLQVRAFSVPYAFVLLNLAAAMSPIGLLWGMVGPAWKARS